MEILAKAHSNNPSALSATDNTLQGLGFNTHIRKNPDGNYLIREDGSIVIDTDNPGYIKFASIHQGYLESI